MPSPATMEWQDALRTQVHSLFTGWAQRHTKHRTHPQTISLLHFRGLEIGQVGNGTRMRLILLNIALLLFLFLILGNFTSIGIFCYSAGNCASFLPLKSTFLLFFFLKSTFLNNHLGWVEAYFSLFSLENLHGPFIHEAVKKLDITGRISLVPIFILRKE